MSHIPPPNAMWGRMWSSSRSSAGDGNPERERCVRMDGARKCTARRWTNQGLKTPSSLDGGVRPLAWVDALLGHGLFLRRAGGGGEPEEIARRGVVGTEDCVGDDVDVVATVIAERSLCKEAGRRRHDEELEDRLFKQAVAANLAVKDKDDEWRRIRKEQREKFIDLVGSGEED
ncbi:ABC transporter B family member 25 [Hordeum vulgare]|nr:ABC transporter B family member 25 [Hordeum vulgare]